MKILLIILVLCLILNVLLLTYPVRLAVQSENCRLVVYWLPFGSRKVCLLKREFAPPDVILALAEGNFATAADILLTKKADKAQKTDERKLSWADIWALIGGGLAAVRVREFRLRIAVGGDPYRAAMLAGSLSAVLSAGLARFSMAVASWTHDVRGAEVTMLSPPSRFVDSRMALSAEFSVRAGGALWQILRRMYKNRV